MSTKHIVIVGAGFAGVSAALAAAAEAGRGDPAAIRIRVIAPDEHLVIRPRLYERDLAGARVPLSDIFGPLGVEHVRETVTDIGALEFDQLVLCAGSRRAARLGAEGDHGVDTYEEAAALWETLWTLAPRRPHVAVIGANFAGIEIAAELAGEAEVDLIDSAATIAPGFGPRARASIAEALDGLGITIHTGEPIAERDSDGVTLANGRRLAADLTVWATGPRASALYEQLGEPVDAQGRVRVAQTLATPVAGVWAAGDGVRVSADGAHDALMSCQHAGPQGRVAGANAVRAALGRSPQPYRQPLYSTCLDLGAAGALLTHGFGRDRVLATGADAKRFKRFINRSLIYPPTGAGPKPLLKFGASRAPGPVVAAIQGRALRSTAMRRRVASSGPDRAALVAG